MCIRKARECSVNFRSGLLPRFFFIVIARVNYAP